MGRLLWLAAALGAAGCGSASAPATVDAFADKLESVTITGKASVPWPLSTQLKATAAFTSGRMLDISNVVTWSSATTAAATVDGDGLVSTVDAGSTMIQAAYEGQSGTFPLTVTMPTIAVASFGSKGIDFFPANATGNVMPIRSIRGGTNTTLSTPRGIAINGNELFVADQAGSVDVFPIDGTGDIAPTRQLKAGLTTIATPNHVAVTDTEIFVGDFTNHVLVFPKTATGGVAPSRTITITGLARANGVAVDQGTLYVLDVDNSALLTMPANSSGTVTPTSLVGAETQIAEPNGIYIKNGEAFIGNSVGSIAVHTPSATGNTLPLRKLSGAATTLAFTDGMAILGNRLYAASSTQVLVFKVGASGNVAPDTAIAGAMTNFNNTLGLAIYGAE
jgi:hypothetical protein